MPDPAEDPVQAETRWLTRRARRSRSLLTLRVLRALRVTFPVWMTRGNHSRRNRILVTRRGAFHTRTRRWAMSTMARDAGVAPRAVGRRVDAARAGARLEVAGGAILRYGLAAILLYFGLFKFSPVEA